MKTLHSASCPIALRARWSSSSNERKRASAASAASARTASVSVPTRDPPKMFMSRPGQCRGDYNAAAISGLQHSAQPHARAQELLRIDRIAIDARFIMQMRPRRAAGRADAADDLSDAHALSDLHV